MRLSPQQRAGSSTSGGRVSRSHRNAAQIAGQPTDAGNSSTPFRDQPHDNEELGCFFVPAAGLGDDGVCGDGMTMSEEQPRDGRMPALRKHRVLARGRMAANIDLIAAFLSGRLRPPFSRHLMIPKGSGHKP